MPKGFVVQIVGLMAIACAAGALSIAGFDRAALALSYPGTLMFLLGILAWIVVGDSRKRWPGSTWHERLLRVLTFTR
jgi:hypothetical protein